MSSYFRDLTKVTFSAPEFVLSEMEAGKIALLPVIADPARARIIDVSLVDSMKTVQPRIAAISGTETRRILQDAGLIDNYSQMIETYAKTAMLNKTTLTKMGKAVGARYFMSTTLLEFREYNDNGTAVSDLSIRAVIMDSRSGEVVWDVTGQGVNRKTLMDKAVSFEELVLKVCDSIMQKLS
jgi:hypothetical protein